MIKKKKKPERILQPDDQFKEYLKEMPFRQAMKKVWFDSNLPGKISTQSPEPGILWNRISMGVEYKGPKLIVGGGPKPQDMTEAQTHLLEELFDQFSKPHLKALRHCIRGLHVFFLKDTIHVLLQFTKTNSGLVTNLKALERWLKFKKPEVTSLLTLIWEKEQIFPFGDLNVKGKNPFRSIFGSDYIDIPLGKEVLTSHFQQRTNTNTSLQQNLYKKITEWLRPGEGQELLFWNPHDGTIPTLCAQKGARVRVFHDSFPLRETLQIQRKKKQSPGFLSSPLELDDFRKTIDSQTVNSLFIESHEKMISKAWFESLDKAQCRKVFRIYQNLNSFGEEARTFRKYGWILLKVTAMPWSHRPKDFKIIAFYTPGKLSDLEKPIAHTKSKSVKPASGGLNFTQS